MQSSSPVFTGEDALISAVLFATRLGASDGMKAVILVDRRADGALLATPYTSSHLPPMLIHQTRGAVVRVSSGPLGAH